MKEMYSKILYINIIITILILFPLSISIVEASSITITIKTVDGEVLPNAIVKIFNSTHTFTSKTGSDGKATLTGVDGKKLYTLEVYYPSGFLVNRISDFNYSALTPKEVKVGVLSKWSITFWDKYGRDRLSNTLIEIIHSENNALRYSGRTDGNGKVEFSYIPLSEANSMVYLINVSYANLNFELEYECSIDTKNIDIKLDLYRVIVKVLDFMNKPIQGVIVELVGELGQKTYFKESSNSTGYSVLKLVPKGDYYLIAKLQEYVVYSSSVKVIKVRDSDVEYSITAQAVRLNITVYDFDGEKIVSGFNVDLVGEIRDMNNKLVARTSTKDGKLRFDHVPFGKFKLNLTIADTTVFFQDYEVKSETVQGSIKAGFYDIKINVDGVHLVNSMIVKYLKGLLKKNLLEIPLDFSRGYATLENVPTSIGYILKLYFDKTEIGEHKVNITRDEEEITIQIRGKNITVNTLNLNDKPIVAEIQAYIRGNEPYFSFKTDPSGVARIGELLPITYLLKGHVMGVDCGQLEINPQVSEEYTLKLNVKNAFVRVYDKDKESMIQDATVELYVGKSKISSTTNSSGVASFENIPLTKYSYKTYFYGFKVAEGELTLTLDSEVSEIVAPGILDVRLAIVDGERQPIDGGRIILSIGDKQIEAKIDDNGFARIRELPNSTIYIERLHYKGVNVNVEPSEINLVRDEMLVVLSTSVYTLQGSVILKNEKPMNFGEVNIYVNGEKISTISLSESNSFSERLPSGEVKIDVIFKKSRVASKTLTLDSPKQIILTAEVYKLNSIFYDTLNKPLEGLNIEVRSDKDFLEELETNEKGVVEVYLPSGSYLLKINYDNRTYDSSIKLREDTELVFMLPIEISNPVILILLPFINIAIVSLCFSKIISIRKVKVKKTRRKLPSRLPRV